MAARHAAAVTAGTTRRGMGGGLPWQARVALLACLAVLYTWMAAHLGVGAMAGGPDESMRSLMPRAIAAGNLFPSGYDPEVIYFLGNWSYAFYPQALGAYLSAFFMKAAEILGFSENACFEAGRMASVCLSVVALTFASLAAERVARRMRLDARLAGAGAIVLMGLWPQYAFLSAYMNNEIVALAGVCLIIYSLVSGLMDGWGAGARAALSAGVIVAALGYWNAYGFILAGVGTFVWSLVRMEVPAREKARLFLTAAIPAAVCVLPFFALNVVRYGDLLGMATFHERYQQWLDAGGQVLQTPYAGGIASMLLESEYVTSTWRSFIGVFGYMSYLLPFLAYLAYTALACALSGAFLARGAREGALSGWGGRVLSGAVALGCAVTVALSLYYSLATDYQPQGRYVIYLLPPLAMAMALGAAPREEGSRAGRVACACLLAAFAVAGLAILACASIDCGWTGVDVTLMQH